MLANPWSWRTADDFERNAKLLADEATAAPAAPRELKPMRARPGDGERKRPSRAAELAEKRLREKAGLDAPSAATDDVVDDDFEGGIPAAAAAGATVATPRFAIAQILAAIAKIDNAKDLDEIERAG